MSPEERREYVRRVVDQAPPPSAETLAELREILRPAVAKVLSEHTKAAA